MKHLMTRFWGNPVWLAIVLLVCPLCCAHAEGTRWAVLIGIEKYDDSHITPRKYAVADVKAVAQCLCADVGFKKENVFVMTSDLPQGSSRPTRANVLKRLEWLAAQAHKDDTFFFFFSGHGFQGEEGKNFLATSDAKAGRTEDMENTSLSLRSLERILAPMHVRQTIFVLDANRNAPQQSKGASDNTRRSIFSKEMTASVQAVNTTIGAAILYACCEGERAWEWPEQQHSVFAYYLVEGLRGKGVEDTGELTMNGIADYVRKEVQTWSLQNLKHQTPDLHTFKVARIHLGQSKLRPPMPTPTPDDTPKVDTRAYLQIVTDPPEAHVRVDDEELNSKSDRGMFTIDLKDERTREVRIVVEQEGYETLLRSVSLESGHKTSLNFTLKRRGKKNVNPNPVPPHIDYASLVPLITLPQTTKTSGALAFSPDSRFLAIATNRAAGGASEAFDLLVWDVEASKPKFTRITGFTDVHCLAFSKDGRLLVSGGAADDSCIHDTEDGHLIQKLDVSGGRVESIVFGEEGNTIQGLLNSGKSLCTWDSKSGRAIRARSTHLDGAGVATLCPTGNQTALASFENIFVWTEGTDAPEPILHNPGCAIKALAFSPSGGLLACGCENGATHVWKAQTGAIVRFLPRQRSPAVAVAFSCDEKTVAVGYADGMLKLWDINTAILLWKQDGHAGPVRSLLFSRDGLLLASIGEEGTIRLWRVQK